MQIGGIDSSSQAIAPVSYTTNNMQSEESTEIRNGTTEEAQNTSKLVKSAEQERGVGQNIDLTA